MSKFMLGLFFVVFASTVRADDLLKASVRTVHSVKESSSVTNHQFGSGTVIKKTADKIYVLSCWHIAHYGGKVAGGELLIQNYEGKYYKAKMLNYDKDLDLSLMEVEGNVSVAVAKVAETDDYKPDTKLMKYGFTLGSEKCIIAHGKIANYTATFNDIMLLSARLNANGGDSGCGIFRESDNKLIGVLWGGREGGISGSRLKEIRKFLKTSKFEF